jgi:hypothetical protein
MYGINIDDFYSRAVAWFTPSPSAKYIPKRSTVIKNKRRKAKQKKGKRK